LSKDVDMDAPKPASPSPVEQELGLFTERESPYIQDAAPLRYRRWPAANAAKPTLVLIHGLFGDMESWPSLLAAALHLGFGVVCVELPSHGDSPCMAESFDNTVEVVAQTVEAALRHAEANTQ